MERTVKKELSQDGEEKMGKNRLDVLKKERARIKQEIAAVERKMVRVLSERSDKDGRSLAPVMRTEPKDKKKKMT